MVTRWDENRAFVARRFFQATIVQCALAGTLTYILIRINGLPPIRSVTSLPAAFQFGTIFLAAGSWFMHQAVENVKVERQQQFRFSLILALLSAVLFVGVQSYGLWAFVRGVPKSAWQQTDVNAFIFMFTALHAMHFLVAQAVLLWIAICAEADRYDHEYYWGVVFAAWCWHVLGIAWMVILAVFAIAL